MSSTLSKAFLPLMNEVVPSGYRLQEYGPLRAIVSKGGAPDEDRQFIIVGYASPQVIDREKHLIKREALAEDLPRFLAHPKYRNANIVHCAVAGTPIKQAGNLYTPIEEIVPGDRVYTHKARLREVLKVSAHEYEGDLYTIGLETGETLQVTPEHRLLTTRGWVKAQDLTTDHVLNHLVKRGHRSWRLDEEISKPGPISGTPRHETLEQYELRMALLLETKRGSLVRMNGALVTAEQRRGKTLAEAYGPDLAMIWIDRISASQRGERSHYWRGGVSRRPYGAGFSTELKKTIRERDGFCCTVCGRTEDEERRLHSRNLSIDHIDWNKQNHDPTNLRSLCVVCHGARNGEARVAVANGVQVISVSSAPFSGLVYNLEVKEDNSYAGRGVIHHNSNIQVAEVLPAWTNPDTGEEWTTHVDEIGLFCVVKVRTDRFRPAICQRVEEDILSGKLNSFSISGDAPFESRQYTCASDQCFWVIDKIELYEITICEEGVNQDAKFSVVAKADAMRLSQFCADGSCPINLGGVGMMNPTETKSPGSAGKTSSGGPAMGSPGARGLQSGISHVDPRKSDEEKSGQDWVGSGQSAQRGRRVGLAVPSMIKRDVNPTAGGGGFNTTRPDQLKAAESEIEDDDGSFGSRVQKYLRKGDLGTMDHGISTPKLETTGGGGKMTRAAPCGGQSSFNPLDRYPSGPGKHRLERENRALELPDNSEPTAIQKGGWAYPRGKGTVDHVENQDSYAREQGQDQRSSQRSARHGAHDLTGQARGAGEGEDSRRLADAGPGGLGADPRSSAPGPSSASRQQASGRRRPEQPDRNDYWRAHEAAPAAESRLLVLTRENAQLATQLQLATQSDEERKRAKNEYMARWRKEHPNGGGGGKPARGQFRAPGKRTTPEEHRRGIAQDTENMPPAMRGVMGGPADQRQPRPKMKMPETDRQGYTAFDRERMARRQELTGNGMRTRTPEENQGITVPPREEDEHWYKRTSGQPPQRVPRPVDADEKDKKSGGDKEQAKKIAARMKQLRESNPTRAELIAYAGRYGTNSIGKDTPTRDILGYIMSRDGTIPREKAKPRRKPEPRRRAYGVEDPDDGAYDRRPTNESRALTLARQIAAAIGADGKPDAPKASAETLKRQDAFNAKMAKKPAKRRPKPQGRGSWGYD